MLKDIFDTIKKNYIVWLSLLFLFLAILFNSFPNSAQHCFLLAKSFLKFKTYFLEMPFPNWSDTVLINNKHYWPLGPFPVLILAPFVYIGEKIGIEFYQNYLNCLLGIAVFYLVFKISIKLSYSKIESTFWAFAFCFVSPFIGVFFMPGSWYYSQTTAVFLTFSFLFTYFYYPKKYWLMGTIIALLAATRPFSAMACTLFILLHLICIKKISRKTFKDMIKIFVFSPFPFIITLILFYNKISFGNYFATGYTTQDLNNSLDLTTARQYGLFNFKHIPGNLYYALINPPEPIYADEYSKVLSFPYLKADRWGMSLFFVSPYLIYLFFIDYKEKLNKILLAVSLITFLPITMYYGIGVRQYGYRYALDFFPFLFLLLIIGYKKNYVHINRTTKLLVIISAFINLWFLLLFISHVI